MMPALPSFLMRPVLVLAIVAAVGLGVYLYCVHRDLHAHNHHLQSLHERLATLEGVAGAAPRPAAAAAVQAASACPLVGPPTGAAAEAEAEAEAEAAAHEADSIQSFCSDELRAMLDVIEVCDGDKAEPPAAVTGAGAEAETEATDLSTCDPDVIKHASYQSLKIFLKSKGLNVKGTRDALVERTLQHRVTVGREQKAEAAAC
jgi:hypothetical protein